MTDEAATAETAPEGPAATPGPSRRNSALVASGILLSRLTGLARERAIAHFFATGFAADAFRAAFRIPNLLQNLLGEGVLSASFIPVYSQLLAEGRREEAGRVAGAVAGLLTAVAAALALVGIFLARPLTLVVAAGLPADTFELTTRLMRILFPAVGFLVLSAWCLGVLNSHRRFFLAYVAPVLMNAAQLGVLVGLGATVYAAEFPARGPRPEVALVMWLAVGTLVGGFLQFAVQLPAVFRVSGRPRPSLRVRIPGVRRTVSAFWPVVAGRGVVQLSAYLDLFLASFLAVGAIAALGFAQVLYVLPISLFGMSVAAAELPDLASMERAERGDLARRVDAGLGRIAFFVVPTVVGYLLVGDLIVGMLFQSGNFDRLVTVQVWLVLVGYTVGLLASTSSRLLQSALYGIGDPRTPAVIAAVRVVLSAAIGVLLMFQLDRVIVTAGGLIVDGDLPAFSPLPLTVREAVAEQEVERLGAAGLALAAGAAAWLEYWWLRRRVAATIAPVRFAGGEGRPMLLAAGAAAAAALAVRFTLGDLHPLIAGPIAIVATAAAYLATARALGVSEIRAILDAVRRRLRDRRG